MNKLNKLQIVTPKYYQSVFDISRNTAIEWYRDDLEMLGRKRMTVVQFDFIYKGIDRMNVPDVFKPSKKTRKAQNVPI